jgi:hypothetical protein
MTAELDGADYSLVSSVGLAPVIGFFRHALEWLAIFLALHEASRVGVALRPHLGLGVEDLSALIHRTDPKAFSRVASHFVPPF